MAKKQKGGGSRKHGRWSRKPSNLRYKAQNRRVVNKLRRLRKLYGTESKVVRDVEARYRMY